MMIDTIEFGVPLINNYVNRKKIGKHVNGYLSYLRKNGSPGFYVIIAGKIVEHFYLKDYENEQQALTKALTYCVQNLNKNHVI